MPYKYSAAKLRNCSIVQQVAVQLSRVQPSSVGYSVAQGCIVAEKDTE